VEAVFAYYVQGVKSMIQQYRTPLKINAKVLEAKMKLFNMDRQTGRPVEAFWAALRSFLNLYSVNAVLCCLRIFMGLLF